MRSISGRDQACGSCGKNFSVSVSIESENGGCLQTHVLESACSWQCGALANSIGENWKDNDLVDELLSNVLSRSQRCSDANEKVYTVVIAKKDEEVRTVVGKHRHGWVIGKIEETEAVEEIFVNMFINGGKNEASGAFMPVGADVRVVLSFSLLNANPMTGFIIGMQHYLMFFFVQ